MRTIFDELDYTFVSNEFNITTPAILSLQKNVVKWIADGTPGAIIYGRELPIYVLNSTDHVAKDKYFYSELLKTVGHPEYEKGTVSALKERLINSFINSACSTKYRKIILFIDEAYHFTEKDFNWLMDIYNNLYLKNIHMTVFMVGSEQLKSRKQALIMAKQHQIVGRFMVEECHFHGIQSAKEIGICLYNFDNQLSVNDHMSLILTKEFFPSAFADGKRLSECSDDIMNEYVNMMKEIGIPTNSEIPMMYFINTIKYCLNTFGKNGRNIYFPDTSAWNESIQNSGYIAAERIYYDVPIG